MLKRRWPATGLAYISQLLTDPTAGLAGDSPVATLDPRAPRAALLPIDANSAAAYVADVAFETLGFTLEDARLLQTYPPTELVNRFTPGTVHYEESKVRPLLEAWPPTRDAILAYVTDGKVGGAAVVAANERETAQVGTHFRSYCLGCHGAGSENGTIPFDDLDALATFENSNGGRVVVRLLQGTMPPPKAEAQPSAEERREMAAFLQRQSDAPDTFRPTPPVRRSYLGVRYLDVPGIRGSYIGRAEWTIHDEGVFQRCAPGAPGLRVARIWSAGGPVVLSLENFPHYALGNLIQGPHAAVQASRCFIVAVTRNGALVRLDYDWDEQTWYTQFLSTDGGPASIGHLAISRPAAYSRQTEAMAVGNDGKLYRLTFDATKASFRPVSLSGVGEGFGWSRVAFGPAEARYFYLERLDGRIFRFSWNGSMASFERLASLDEAAFAPSLLRPDGVLLNPHGPEPDPTASSALVPSELAGWDGPFGAETQLARWTPPPAPTWKPTPPAEESTGSACSRKYSARECRGKTIGESCTYESASGTRETGTCRVATGTTDRCSCY